jgi:hypothetical protein
MCSDGAGDQGAEDALWGLMHMKPASFGSELACELIFLSACPGPSRLSIS